jgi:two-component system response regulator (stage 0 sporulation protein A)
MGTLLTKAIEEEFKAPSPLLITLFRKLIREEITSVVSEELGATQTLIEAPQSVEEPVSAEADLFNYVTNMMRELGIPAHILGHGYIREAVISSHHDPELLGSITKKMYPTLASRFNTTPNRVERAIRHAIELTCTRSNMEGVKRMFGNTINGNLGKPTNSHFIATFVDRLRVEYGRK